MSSKLKKKNKSKNKHTSIICDCEKKAFTAQDAVGWMSYLALLDVLGYKIKRLKKYHEHVNALVLAHESGNIFSGEMDVRCKKIGIDAMKWIVSIPEKDKVALARPHTIITKQEMMYVDAGILNIVLPMIITLKEVFNVSLPGIKRVMEHMKNSISCYGTKQPKSKQYYLSNDMIFKIFRDELKLDLVTGEKVIGGIA